MASGTVQARRGNNASASASNDTETLDQKYFTNFTDEHLQVSEFEPMFNRKLKNASPQPPATESEVQSGGALKASYVDSKTKKKSFICCETPKSKGSAVLTEFWNMVWEKNVKAIVALDGKVATPGPTVFDTLQFDGVSVKKSPTLDEETDVDIFSLPDNQVTAVNYGNYRIISINKSVRNKLVLVEKIGIIRDDEKRAIYRLNCNESSSEPDRDQAGPLAEAAEWTYTKFLRLFDQADRNTYMGTTCDSPILIYCADGKSRTGVFLTVLTCIQNIISEEKTNKIVKVIADIRKQRPDVVNSVDQLALCYKAVVLFCRTFDRESDEYRYANPRRPICVGGNNE